MSASQGPFVLGSPEHPVTVLLVHEREVPPGSGWLSPSEREVEATLTVAKRRADWRRGRWAARRLLQRVKGWPPARVEVRASPDGAPEVWHQGERARSFLSLSHSGEWAAAALAEVPVGCDLERIEPRSPAFQEDYFSQAERAGWSDAALSPSLAWSAKESALKLLRTGLRGALLDFEARPALAAPGQTWARLRVQGPGGELCGWWGRPLEDFVVTVVRLVDVRVKGTRTSGSG